MLKNPSSAIVSVGDTCDDLSIDGERLFHAIIMLRTELSRKCGDTCGRLGEVPGGVMALVSVKPYDVEVKVSNQVRVSLV